MSDYDPQAGRPMPDAPGSASSRTSSDREDLQDGLRGLAGLVSTASGIDELLAQVSEFAADAIPDVDGAGVTLLRSGPGRSRVQSRATTAEFVREIDRIQYDVVDEGPCLRCIELGRPVISGSLGSDRRWPRFGGPVARLGVHSALCLPLVVRDTVVGAINAYSRSHDVFSEHAVRLGERFAGPAAVAVHNAQLLDAARAQAEQLHAALSSRAVIDQAIGIMRSRTGATAEEAFDRLRRASQSDNVKLAVVAQRLVDEAVRSARARHSGR